MTTNSYPAVGAGGFTDGQWRTVFGNRDGILGDYVGNALAITRDNSTDTVTVGLGKVAVGGYVVEVTAGEVLSMPTVASGATDYHVCAVYDPALNVADLGGGRSALGPARIRVATTAELAAPGTKTYLPLYKVTRIPNQLLASSAFVDYRRWVGLPFELSASVPAPTNVPRGSVMYATSAGGEVATSVRTLNLAGTALEWTRASEGTITLPLVSGVTLFSRTPEAFRFSGRMVGLSGDCKSSAFNSFQGAKQIGLLPTGWRPLARERFAVSAKRDQSSEDHYYATVLVEPTGEVNLAQTGIGMGWIDLSGVRFRVS